jgi:DNA-binding XRE family transcriptional regulator
MEKRTLKAWRCDTDLTQKDIAERIGINVATYNAIEACSEEDLRKIAAVLKIDRNAILMPRPLSKI